jgi:uncharacterized protein
MDLPTVPSALVGGCLIGVGASLLFLFTGRLGLGLSGMTHPNKVVGFLDFFGGWEPTLAFVMAGAVGSHALLHRLVMRRRAPLFAAGFSIPGKRDIDWTPLLGSAVCGAGWGLSGYCPDPAIVSLPSASPPVLVFSLGMVLGMAAYGLVFRERVRTPAGAGGAP